MSIAESLSSSHKEHEKEEKDKLHAREFEISLTRCLSNHKVCLGLLTCLQEQYCSDSVVISRMQLTRVKGEYLLRHGISKSYKEETISILQKCDAFSVGFDEPEINKTSVHSHRTRSNFNDVVNLEYSNNLHILYASTSFYGLKLIEVFGPKFWNSIPLHIRSAVNIKHFSKVLKLYLVNIIE